MITVYSEVYAFLISCIKREGKVYRWYTQNGLSPAGQAEELGVPNSRLLLPLNAVGHLHG